MDEKVAEVSNEMKETMQSAHRSERMGWFRSRTLGKERGKGKIGKGLIRVGDVGERKKKE